MIDSVLKGTGNSRFLKSAVPAGTSWADALAMLQAGTFPIDFNGINTEGFQQVGTPLNKANLLKDATAAQIGLPPSTTPDGMFQALGNTGELHVWRKTVTTAQEIPAGYTLGASAAKTLAKSSENSGNSYATFYISSSISVDDAGNVTMNSPATVDIWQGIDAYDSDERAIFGKFIKFYSVSNSSAGITSDLETGIYFIPNSAEFTRYRDGRRSGYTNISACQKVNAYPLTPAGTTTTYPVSTNPNAYQEGDDAKEAGYTLGEVIKSTGAYGFFGMMGFAYGTSYFQKISDAIKVADDGSVSHVAPVDDISDSTVLDSASVLKERIAGKYITLSENSYTKQPYTNELPPTNAVLYIPADVNVKMIHPEGSSLSNQYALFFDRYQPVTGYAAIPAGTTIEYLGKLGDKARVQVVSYVGTGTYGSSNPNSLTFDFVPKMVFIFSQLYSNAHVYNASIVPDAGVFSTYITSDGDNTRSGFCHITRKNKTITWYCNDAGVQLNISGVKYFAVAIG